jgi:hypothetical protein
VISGKRQPKATKGTRAESIRVRVTPKLRADIEELAALDSRTMSAWIELALKRVVEEAKRKK